MLAKRVIILVVIISVSMGVAGCAQFSERQRIYAEASSVGAGVGAAVANQDNRAAVAALGGMLGCYVGFGHRRAATLKRSYIGIDPKLIIDYTVHYFASEGYDIQTKDYSKGDVAGKEQSRIVKKVFWFIWKEQNKFICQIRSDLINKNKLYVYLTIRKERKKPLSSEFSPVTTKNYTTKKTVEFLNYLDALVVKNGGKLG